MDDLVWVGNTLLPRGVVIVGAFFLAASSITLIAVSLAGIILGVEKIFGKRPPD